MMDLIVFSVGTNRYAINIENVQRIIQSVEATNIPNSHEYIDGMISYEDKVIKILNFRKVIDMKTYQSEMTTLFDGFKNYNEEWIVSLKLSIETGAKFTKTLDSHASELGKWIDSFTAYDDTIAEVLNKLTDYHKQLYLSGSEALDMYEKEKDEAMEIFNVKIMTVYEHMLSALNRFISDLGLVVNSLQKLIIYDKNDSIFAVKIDTIEDIAHVKEDTFISASGEDDMSEFLELDGVLDINGVLINVVKTVKLPS